ncbi:MAG: hypothetical protein KAT71_08505 [Gammaproteobacteria bacterium]|nr:hypothetical protein [Gammaproteobacteria bacterium]
MPQHQDQPEISSDNLSDWSWLEIFKYLNLGSRIQLGRTCRRLHALSKHESLPAGAVRMDFAKFAKAEFFIEPTGQPIRRPWLQVRPAKIIDYAVTQIIFYPPHDNAKDFSVELTFGSIDKRSHFEEALGNMHFSCMSDSTGDGAPQFTNYHWIHECYLNLICQDGKEENVYNLVPRVDLKLQNDEIVFRHINAADRLQTEWSNLPSAIDSSVKARIKAICTMPHDGSNGIRSVDSGSKDDELIQHLNHIIRHTTTNPQYDYHYFHSICLFQGDVLSILCALTHIRLLNKDRVMQLLQNADIRYFVKQSSYFCNYGWPEGVQPFPKYTKEHLNYLDLDSSILDIDPAVGSKAVGIFCHELIRDNISSYLSIEDQADFAQITRNCYRFWQNDGLWHRYLKRDFFVAVEQITIHNPKQVYARLYQLRKRNPGAFRELQREVINKHINSPAIYCSNLQHLCINGDLQLRDILYNALCYGNLTLAKWVLTAYPSTDFSSVFKQELLNLVAENGDVDTVTWLYQEQHISPNSEFMSSAARSGNTKLFDVIRLKTNNDMLLASLASGSFSLAHWLNVSWGLRFERGFFPEAFHETAESGNLELLQWVIGKAKELGVEFSLQYNFEFFLNATASGSIELMEWLFAEFARQNARRDAGQYCRLPIAPTALLGRAAGAGHLELLKWLCEEQKFVPDIDTLNSATAAGYIHIVEWLKTNYSLQFLKNDFGIDWNECISAYGETNLCAPAIALKHVNNCYGTPGWNVDYIPACVLKQLPKKLVWKTEKSLHYGMLLACRCGNFGFVQSLVTEGVHPSKDCLNTVIMMGYLPLLQYIIDNSTIFVVGPCEYSYYLAVQYERLAILQYMLNKAPERYRAEIAARALEHAQHAQHAEKPNQEVIACLSEQVGSSVEQTNSGIGLSP